MEELRSIFTVIAVLVSVWSGSTVRRLWYQANRPIVSAAIKENTSANGSVIFDLVVFNSGNRPAVDIVLEANKNDINKILRKETKEATKEEIYQVFSMSSRIQLLLNGDETKTAFFGFATNPTDQIHVLEYEAELPVEIKYKDLEGNKYNSKLSLYLRDSKGFGGSVWTKST